MFIVVLVLLARVVSAYGDETPSIKTSNGIVRGKMIPILVAVDTEVDMYLGIPYAKPPLGELRFKKPQPAEPWKGTLDATDWPPACPQYSSYAYPWYDQNPDGKSEDCLYLNVFTPSNDHTLRPVILFIHGGGFQVGSNRMPNYNGIALAADGNEKDGDSVEFLDPAVVVTINYRLGALGFLTTGTDDAPGNVGMYDMIMALNWVNENIKAFGGDPKLITLYGQGAGSIAVSLFCVSPLTKGLFQRAILHSGSFVSHRKDSSKRNRELSERLAQDVGCTSQSKTFKDHPKEIVRCLQDIDANKLAVALNSIDPTETMMFYPEYDGELLPSDPVQALIDGKVHNVPIIVGASLDEGSYLLTTKYPEVLGAFGEKDTGGLNMTFAKSVLRGAFESLPDPESVVQHYLGEVPESDEYSIRRWTYRALGDDRILCPLIYFAKKYGDLFGEVHFFAFDFRPGGMPWAEWMGSVHYNDAPYLLSFRLRDHVYDRNHPYALHTAFSMRTVTIIFGLAGSIVRDEWEHFDSRHRNYFVFNDSTSDPYDFSQNVEFVNHRYRSKYGYLLKSCNFLLQQNGL